MRQSSNVQAIGGKWLARSFFSGLSTLVKIPDYSPKTFRRENMSVKQALRRDFERVGSDMFKAVATEKSREKAAS